MQYGVNDISITQTREVTGTNANGQPEQQIQITYNVAKHGPFMHAFPKATFDPTQVKAEIMAFAQKLGQLSY